MINLEPIIIEGHTFLTILFELPNRIYLSYRMIKGISYAVHWKLHC